MLQSWLQPSPSLVLPSSHCSTLAVPEGSQEVSIAPLPHFGATNGHDVTLRVLMYHKVNDVPGNPVTVPPALFDEQMAAVAEGAGA